MNADHEFQRIRLSTAFTFTVVRSDQRFQILPRNDTVQSLNNAFKSCQGMIRSKVSRNLVLLAPPSCGEVSANKSANEGALIFIITLFSSVLIISHHPPFCRGSLDFHISLPGDCRLLPGKIVLPISRNTYLLKILEMWSKKIVCLVEIKAVSLPVWFDFVLVTGMNVVQRSQLKQSIDRMSSRMAARSA